MKTMVAKLFKNLNYYLENLFLAMKRRGSGNKE